MAGKSFITLGVLEEIDACFEAQECFINKYGADAKIAVEILYKDMVDLGLYDYLVWLMGSHLSFCKSALRAGCSMNILDSSKSSPLIWASFNGKLQIIKYLVSSGADLNLKDTGGRSALFIAVDFGYIGIAKMLVRAGADVDVKINSNRDIFDMVAARSYWPASFKKLVQSKSKNLANKQKEA